MGKQTNYVYSILYAEKNHLIRLNHVCMQFLLGFQICHIKKCASGSYIQIHKYIHSVKLELNNLNTAIAEITISNLSLVGFINILTLGIVV